MDKIQIIESKSERFVRIAEARTNKIIDMIRLLGNCSNLNNYEYDKKDVDKIFNTLQKELDNAKGMFAQSLQPKKKFKLGE